MRAPEIKSSLKSALLYPVITEKSSMLQAHNQYVFAVEPRANKMVIAQAIETVYGIKPMAVGVSWVRGKTRVRGRRRGKTPNWKKAIVTLPQGKTITVAEGV
ncbi:50S ribosomal protein L23 [Candidatus Uhrbacteria bacterium RIFCSPLOWO2_12_FULL_46_10]|uniref:Large ribosomal subunit protein uL23 n=1 Tax=Candidatus Uhrbacteria bacterium RIFCSPLOWO2_01_FULL_47_25 TaxID=1802402 RepID=A0A1F7UWY9_9BACT|nr:MAG: 50S ribosomal protein L23 [Candidatus Uhrbacteria bacterium RIFCSPHIGHO2_01_FULL_46_23]OGL70274.1 MAG: 50S ribosomal protein L23 [Candidatus Uhrbacteria bacterium RIFCSPHIGHO2_02_FULL_47_29]OGL74694.1 MAG: 50S ribosomal protein L23 [Candidatus Uhrbacteria bacterium RIFCSPHIGHO2_12_FULL_46_13]OGL82811.1 MAG: 50S ribosomal protein L23 [Candidatus Uhrbacteria bacterium RIFCSPLOWO2_01_FULL_47_25]OGL83905.1 MAG: 50S ribosomal protein L23 [Candidatus Uhrbacteria bacterium RIFCSPLOWO2_02_FULL_